MILTRKDLGEYFYTVGTYFDKENKTTHKKVLKGKLITINTERECKLEDGTIKEKSYTTVWLDLTDEPYSDKDYWYRTSKEIYKTEKEALKEIKDEKKVNILIG